MVAGEIKELSKQTAVATQEIKSRIDGIQSVTLETVKEIGSVVGVITEISDIVSTIATAVEEQTAATREISQNITQASAGIQDVNEKISRNAGMASVISREIADVDESAGEMLKNSDKVNLSADQLTDLARQLSEKVSKFKI